MKGMDRERLLEFADRFDIKVGNTFCKKDIKNLIIFKSGGNSSVIDYVVVKKKMMKRIRGVKVILGEECFPKLLWI